MGPRLKISRRSHEVQRRVPAAARLGALPPEHRRAGGQRHEEARRHRAEVIQRQRGDGGGGRDRGHGDRLRAAARAECPARHDTQARPGVRPDLRQDQQADW